MFNRITQYPKEITAELILSWSQSMGRNHVTEQEFSEACEWALDHQSEFPAPADIIARIDQTRARKASLPFPNPAEVQELPAPPKSTNPEDLPVTKEYARARRKLMLERFEAIDKARVGRRNAMQEALRGDVVV